MPRFNFMLTRTLKNKSAFSTLAIILLLAAWAFLSFRIGAAWLGHQDANGAWISAALRNYERYSFGGLSGLVTFDTTPELLNQIPDYYIRHPPLAVWISYPFIAASGFHEALVRIIYAGCTLISAAALATLTKRLLGRGEIWALALYLFTPMMLYFGRMPDHEAPALMFVLLLAIVLVDWIRRPTRKRFVVAAMLMVALAWTAWGGLILGISLCGILLFAYRRRWRGLLGLIAAGIIPALAVILYYQLIWSGAIEELINFFIWRTSNASGTRETAAFTAIEYVARIALRLFTLFTPTVLALAIIGIWQARRGTRLSIAILSGFLFGALAFILVFRNASFIHDYYLIYFAPGIALLATITILESRQAHRFRRFIRPVVTALLLIWPVITIVVLGFLYTGSTNDEPLRLAASLRQHTAFEDMIVSNHPNDGMAIELYSEREISWDVPPEMIASLDHDSRRLFYLFCGEQTRLNTLEPIEVIQASDSCWLAHLE